MASIGSSDHPLPVSKRRLKPLSLRDYLLDDLSSCSSNGFKSFPRRQSSSTVCFLLDAEIKRSGMFRYNRRLTCGLVFTHAVQRASTVLLSAFKLLSFPSAVKSPYPSRKINDKSKNAVFSRRLLSRSFWRKSSTSELDVDGENGRKLKGNEQENKRWKTFADLLQESQDQPSVRVSSCSCEATLSNPDCESSNSEATQSSSGESETSNENDAVEDEMETRNGVVMRSGDCVGSHVSDGSNFNDNRKECVNEEREQNSPISILECPFEDDAISPHSHQNETDEKKLIRKSRRFTSLIRLVPVDLDNCIEKNVERQDYDSHTVDTAEDQSENRANHLFALVKSRLIEEPNHLLASHNVDNLLLDFFEENRNHVTLDDDMLVNIVEEWVMRREEEEDMFMSWEISEKREIYVKEMKWGCINGDEREYVVEELGNCFVSFLIDELVLDLSL